jgi:hypothetical protein
MKVAQTSVCGFPYELGESIHSEAGDPIRPDYAGGPGVQMKIHRLKSVLLTPCIFRLNINRMDFRQGMPEDAGVVRFSVDGHYPSS